MSPIFYLYMGEVYKCIMRTNLIIETASYEYYIEVMVKGPPTGEAAALQWRAPGHETTLAAAAPLV